MVVAVYHYQCMTGGGVCGCCGVSVYGGRRCVWLLRCISVWRAEVCVCGCCGVLVYDGWRCVCVWLLRCISV